MESKVEQTLTNFYRVYYWTTHWNHFSEHRFKSDAEIIKDMLIRNVDKETIKAKIQELNNISLNKLL